MSAKRSRRQSPHRNLCTLLKGFKAGIELTRAEIKPWEQGRIRFTDADVSVRNRELWLHHVLISFYSYVQDEDPRLGVLYAPRGRLIAWNERFGRAI